MKEFRVRFDLEATVYAHVEGYVYAETDEEAEEIALGQAEGWEPIVDEISYDGIDEDSMKMEIVGYSAG